VTATVATTAITPATPEGPDALVAVRGLTKTFPGLTALDRVDISVGAGEVLAVAGANGSGKSTLVKVLAGVYTQDAGCVTVRGDDGMTRDAAAVRDRLHFIHQDLGLVGLLDTVENLDIGRAPGRAGLLPLRRRAEVRRARETIAHFGADFDVRRPIASLSAAERTVVAIARALDGWTRPDNVLVLDEPTAALHGAEVEKLFVAVRRVAARGAGVVFISHRLDEVLHLADRVVVLRDGRKVADAPIDQVDHDLLVRMIAGRDVAQHASRVARRGDDVLRVRALRGASVRGVDLDLREGEILGVAGLLGSGREQLNRMLFGAIGRRGEVEIDGRPLRPGDPAASVAHGLAFVPAERRDDGAVMTMNVRENLTLPSVGALRTRWRSVDHRAERNEVTTWASRVDLRPLEPERRLELFSGGNQQKVVLAKWLRDHPRVLLLDDPTQGVDVGAKDAIYALLVQAAASGAGVLVCSSDDKELALLCDRVLVVRDGTVALELEGEALTEDRLVRESLGLGEAEAAQLFGANWKETHA
jgi:ribose transport system ATP-binding protein